MVIPRQMCSLGPREYHDPLHHWGAAEIWRWGGGCGIPAVLGGGRAGGLVHCIAAFAFAFAMAIPRCQWRHRCVVTLGKFLVVLYNKPLWRKENGSKGGKAMRAM